MKQIDRKAGDEMKVLVCDDEAQVREQLKKAVDEILGVGSCAVCKDQESLLMAVESDIYDVVIMDIEWNGKEKGIHFAEMLKTKSPLTEIIYLTGYTQKYVQQVFFHPSNLCAFLTKPLEMEMLKLSLEKVKERQAEKKDSRFVFQHKGVTYSVDYDSILYVESRGRELQIHTDKEMVICFQKLNEAEKSFPAQFVRCHQSYLVNMDMICKLDKGHTILLENNETLPISKLRYKETRERFYQYLQGKAFQGKNQ